MADSKKRSLPRLIPSKDNPNRSIYTTFDALFLYSLYYASKHPDDFKHKIDSATDEVYFKLKDILNYTYSLVSDDSVYKQHSSDNSKRFKNSAEHFIAWAASHTYRSGLTAKLTDIYPNAPRGYHRILPFLPLSSTFLIKLSFLWNLV